MLEAGDLRIDPGARREVDAASDEVALTAREFDVLEFLMRRAGEVVSKTRDPRGRLELRRTTATPTSSRSTSDVALKIDRPFERESIQTIRGAGYRLDSDGG